jgi:hypothetical protein
VTGDRRGLETKIASEVEDLFTHHLDKAGDVERLSLILYTRGGETLAAWTLANLLRQFCKHLEVIVPAKAHSAGTLLCLAADKIIMTKQATLGPIDPSVNTPINPPIPGAPPHIKLPVNVEDIGGFIDFARSLADCTEQLGKALQLLSTQVHPLVLGNAFRARGQIRMLARKLMAKRQEEDGRTERLLEFLCSESGSHDYTINRREAKEELGLPVDKPDDALYSIIKRIYDDVARELRLHEPFDPNVFIGASDGQVPYSHRRAIVETLAGGVDLYVSEGVLSRQNVMTPQGPQLTIQDQRLFEGWRHDSQ